MRIIVAKNRHSRGVLRGQKELKANENGEVEYDFSYQAVVMVKEMKSPRGEQALHEAIILGFVAASGEKPSNMMDNDEENFFENNNKVILWFVKEFVILKD